MADVIKLKRDATPGLAPSTSQLALGELAVNTYDGKLYFKKNDGTEAIVEVGNPVPTNAVNTAAIQDNAVTTAKIASGAVTSTELGSASVTSAKINTGAVGTTKLGASAVTTAKINDSAVTSNKLAANSVTSAKIVDGTIVGGDIAASTITSSNILNGTITADDCDNTVAKVTSTTGAFDLPAGTTAQRDTSNGAGSFRYNTDDNATEFYNGTNWIPFTNDNGITVDSDGISMSGSFTGNFTATGEITAYSDERLKHEWQDLESDVLDKALDVKFGTYERKDIDPNVRHIGVSAQDLAKVMPEAARLNDDGYYSVNYGASAMALVLELNKEVQKLKEEIKQLKDK